MLACLCCACSQSGPQLGNVEGTIRLDGKPLTNATVTFIPVSREGSTATGRTDAEGRYVMLYTFRSIGALAGPSDVIIEPDTDEKTALSKSKFPDKYKLPGELTADVQTGSQTIDFELHSK